MRAAEGRGPWKLTLYFSSETMNKRRGARGGVGWGLSTLLALYLPNLQDEEAAHSSGSYPSVSKLGDIHPKEHI